MNNLNISVVIPVYNSEKSLAVLIDEIIIKLKKKHDKYEIILIDDASTDKSWNIIKDCCAKNNFIKAIQLRKNSGQHNAIFAGLKYSLGNFIVTMDDDGQNSPDDIDLLVDEVKKGFDVAYGNYKIKKHNIFRRFGSYLNNLIASFLFNKPKNIVLTSFRAFHSSIKNEILKSRSHTIYLDGLIFSITKSISNVYVDHKERKHGDSNYTFFKLLGLWSQMATGFSILPLRISSILGIVFSILSFLVSIWIIFLRPMSSELPVGWTSLIVVVIFFGGIQLLALGLIGEYIGRSYLTINKTIQYSEKNTLNIQDKIN